MGLLVVAADPVRFQVLAELVGVEDAPVLCRIKLLMSIVLAVMKSARAGVFSRLRPPGSCYGAGFNYAAFFPFQSPFSCADSHHCERNILKGQYADPVPIVRGWADKYWSSTSKSTVLYWLLHWETKQKEHVDLKPFPFFC